MSGRCKIWRTRSGQFRLPIKYGQNDYGAITDQNASLFHLGDCPADSELHARINPNISIDRASEAILALKPVSFRYRKEIDSSGTSQFGSVAEEVADINADLVRRDVEGKPETVRYDAVNAMLLDEFLKEHRRVQELEATVAQQKKDSEATAVRQQKEIEALTAGLQKVSAQLEASKPAPQVVDNP